MLICHCAVVNDRKIKELAAGNASVEAIGTLCGAGRDCGSCVDRIEAIVAAHVSEAPAILRVAS
ncbi:MAG: (2Fe-2S)-binding protein [Actinomycetota bacterium]